MTKTKTDEEFLERIKEMAPEVLEAEVDFDERIIRALPPKKTNVTVKPQLRKKSKRKPLESQPPQESREFRSLLSECSS
jgi:hypothetical protein